MVDEELQHHWSALQELAEVQPVIQLQDYLTVDDEVAIGGTMTLDEIVKEATSNADETVVESDEEIDEVVEREPVNGVEALQAFHQLRRYFRENKLDSCTESIFRRFEQLLMNDRMAKSTQLKISSFFARV